MRIPLGKASRVMQLILVFQSIFSTSYFLRHIPSETLPAGGTVTSQTQGLVIHFLLAQKSFAVPSTLIIITL